MASLFRRKVAMRIAQSVLDHKTCGDTDKLASLIKVNTGNMKKPQLTFSWKRGVELQLLAEPEINHKHLYALNGKGLILADGIVNVEDSQDKHSNILFTIDRDYFIKEVLLEAYHNVETLKKVSPVLSNLPSSNVVVEYSSPNIAKPLHAGHIRSTIIGHVVGNIHRYMGNTVHRINYLGDWGTQYGILSAGYERFSSEFATEEDPLKHLYHVYVVSNQESESNYAFLLEAKEIFRKMEAGDENYLQQWKEFREISIKELNKIYSRLGVEFDNIQSESMYYKAATDLTEQLLNKKLATHDSNGAVHIRIPWPNQEDRTMPLLKNDGSTLYISRDLAAAIDRKQNYNFDTAIYVVERNQSDHFIALKSLLKKMGHEWAEYIRIYFCYYNIV